ncbi:MAG: RNA methyltransferase [Balneolaceae bacterium]
MKSASNKEVTLLRKLSRRKYRDKDQLFLVEGERAVEQVLTNGLVEVVSVFVNEEKAGSFQASAISVLLAGEIFEEVADTDNPQGILALCRMPEEIQAEKLANESGIIVATDAIQDPGNMGTIIRTSAWFGVKALLAGKGSVDVYHPKVVRSTAGATGSVPIIQNELEDIFTSLEKTGWEILLLDGGEGSQNLVDIHPANKTVLVVGNEGNGIHEKLLNSGRKKVRIERAGEEKAVESLNAAVAVSIALYEVNGARS